jgi:KDO2-lipid IV(A) lauroyltransferase
MIKALRRGEGVGLLPDQVPPEGQGLWAPFFGRNAYTMTLAARLAQQTGATVLLARCERLSWGRGFLLVIEPLPAALDDSLEAAVLQINRAMEHVIRQCPDQYLWGYARYKQPRAEAPAGGVA